MVKHVNNLKGRSTRKGVFKNAIDCWNSSAKHQQTFIHKRKCNKVLYHKVACNLFDNYVESLQPNYRIKLLHYYKVQGTFVLLDIPNVLNADETLVRRMAGLKLTRLSRNEVLKRGLLFKEDEFYTFQEDFDISGEEFMGSRLKRKAMLNTLTRCIKSRLEHRKKCIKDCSTNIPTGSHDIFITKLAILRARLLRDLSS